LVVAEFQPDFQPENQPEFQSEFHRVLLECGRLTAKLLGDSLKMPSIGCS
jgi:hypothetical protein